VRALLPYLVLGLVSGSVYGLTAMGLVLTYKTTGVFNFAHGAVATGAAYLFYELNANRGLPWPVALVATVALIAVLGGPLMELIGSRLRQVPVATQVVATIGLLLAVQGIVVAIFGAVAMPFPAFLSSRTVRLPGVYVGIDQIVVFAVGTVLAALLFLFFRSSRTGLPPPFRRSYETVTASPDICRWCGGRRRPYRRCRARAAEGPARRVLPTGPAPGGQVAPARPQAAAPVDRGAGPGRVRDPVRASQPTGRSGA